MKTLLLLLLLVLIEIIVGIIFICVMNNIISKGHAAENNREIGVMEKKLSPCEIKRAYHEFMIDTFLRKNFPELERWEYLYETSISNFNGRHHVMICLPGNRKARVQFTIDVNENIIQLYKPEMGELEAEKWLEKWQQKIFTAVEKEGNILIKIKDLPSTKNALSKILSSLEMSGEYFINLTNEGLVILPLS